MKAQYSGVKEDITSDSTGLQDSRPPESGASVEIVNSIFTSVIGFDKLDLEPEQENSITLQNVARVPDFGNDHFPDDYL